MILIYSDNNSPRLEYTLEVMFHLLLRTEYEWTQDLTYFQKAKNRPRLHYSTAEIEGSLGICPHALLSEKGIRKQDIEVTYRDGIPYFFETCRQNEIPYDLLASTFYMISRYEEYLPFTPDRHGRFPAKESLSFKAGFLHLPVVHLWAHHLRQKLNELYPELTFPSLEYRMLDSIDIDYAYRYKGKPLFRRLFHILRILVNRDHAALKSWKTYRRTGKDPYDTYDYIHRIREKQSRERIFFIQTGQYGQYDKNIPLNSTFRKLLRRLVSVSNIGLHPSYASAEHPERIEKEKKLLESATGTPITRSRQHYLRMRLPSTYEHLIDAGIEEDYTMGYPDALGFRSGIAVPYPYYNLLREEKMPLSIIPFQVMDVTLRNHLSLSPEQAIEEIRKLQKTLRTYGGIFVSLFHNSSLSEDDEWKGWRKVYEALDG